MYYVPGFMKWGATAVPEPKIFGKGLIFVEDTYILLSGDKWTIAGNIALDVCNSLVTLMKSILGHICKKYKYKRTKRHILLIYFGKNRFV